MTEKYLACAFRRMELPPSRMGTALGRVGLGVTSGSSGVNVWSLRYLDI